MKKKELKKLQLSRETFRDLESSAVKQAVGATEDSENCHAPSVMSGICCLRPTGMEN